MEYSIPFRAFPWASLALRPPHDAHPPQRARIPLVRPDSMTSHESTADDDAATLSAIATGDERAFLRLYDRFSGPIHSLLIKMLPGPQDAEDVLQTVFFQIWRKAAAYDSTRCSVFTWLVLIARSKAIDALRARQRQSRTLGEAALDDSFQPVSAETAGTGVGHHDNQAAIRAALDRIPSEQRQAIEMAFFRGLSQSEIAESLAEPLGTIKARIRRGMLRLRELLLHRL